MRYICTAVVATLVLAGTSFAATINVPSDQPTIAAAISASVNGDVIAIAAGTYYEHTLNPDGKAITIGSASGSQWCQWRWHMVVLGGCHGWDRGQGMGRRLRQYEGPGTLES